MVRSVGRMTRFVWTSSLDGLGVGIQKILFCALTACRSGKRRGNADKRQTICSQLFFMALTCRPLSQAKFVWHPNDNQQVVEGKQPPDSKKAHLRLRRLHLHLLLGLIDSSFVISVPESNWNRQHDSASPTNDDGRFSPLDVAEKSKPDCLIEQAVIRHFPSQLELFSISVPVLIYSFLRDGC